MRERLLRLRAVAMTGLRRESGPIDPNCLTEINLLAANAITASEEDGFRFRSTYPTDV
jgi:hypothetical protein